MMAILPIVTFAFMWGALSRLENSWRAAFIHASILFGVVVVVLTEALSLGRLVTPAGVAAAWVVCLGLAAFFYYIVRRRVAGNEASAVDLTIMDGLLLTGLAAILVMVAVIAWVAPPNTWDSMTYHMSRVVHWIQNRSVAHYPTQIDRQLYLGPWSEFAILQFQVLAGNDRFANLVQWFSLAGSAVGVALIAGLLGGNPRGQVLAATFAVTLPMGILQGSSTQTDLVVAYWLVCLVACLMLLDRKPHGWHALAAGGALGLAILTKATAYLFALPVLTWFGLRLLRAGWPRGLRLLGSAAVMAATLNLGHYGRNFQLFGHPFGPMEGEGYSNEVLSAPATLSNLIRNLAIHTGTPYGKVNAFEESLVFGLHQVIGISPHDPRTTWHEQTFKIQRITFHEDISGNPAHMVLIGLVAVGALLGYGRRPGTLFYPWCLAASFLLFCAYLKWQPWNSRLHLPWFVLWAPFVGLALAGARRQWPGMLAAALLISLALPWLLKNQSRPVIGPRSIFVVSRQEQYFANHYALYKPYSEAARYLHASACSRVALLHVPNSWEYPLWVLLKEPGHAEMQIEFGNVFNASAATAVPGGSPPACALIEAASGSPPGLVYAQGEYAKVWTSDVIAIFMPPELEPGAP